MTKMIFQVWLLCRPYYKVPAAKADALRNGDAVLFVCLFVCLCVCRRLLLLACRADHSDAGLGKLPPRVSQMLFPAKNFTALKFMFAAGLFTHGAHKRATLVF